MAREMKNKPKAFSLENSDAIEENERILAAGSQQRKEKREKEEEKNSAPTQEIATQEQTPATQEPAKTDTTPDTLVAKSKKTANGIVVNVPMEDYLQLTLMKCRTGRTLKDLALQAIHEFVERNK